MSQTSRIELDPELYELRREEGLYRLNVERNSIARAIVFPLFAALIVLHNRILSIDTPMWALVAIVVWPLFSWMAARLLYQAWPAIADVLLGMDLFVSILGIHASGGERSLFFFVPLVRVVDQTHAGMKRVLVFGHLAVASYLGLMMCLEFAGRDISWEAEAIKASTLYIAALYTASVARVADSKRRRLVNAVDVAREAAEERERVTHRNELILESAGVGIAGIDSRGLVVFANSRAFETVGLSPSEMIGRPAHEVARHMRPDGSRCDGSDCILMAALESRREFQGEHSGFVRHDGRVVPVEFTSAPIFEDGSWQGAVFSFRDISERKEMEREILAARDAAEAANRAKSRFLATMSHELRTPLNAILGYSEMLDEELADADRDDLLPDLRRIRSSGRQLLAMIDDLLEIASLETGDVALEIERIDLVALGKEIEDVIAPTCREKGNAFRFEHGESIPFQGDATKIRRILLHLLGNANKFTEKGDIVLRIEPEDSPGRSGVVFRVADTGQGMSDDEGRRAFDVFQQIDGSTTRRHDGAGVGLTVARRLAQLMGGDITLRTSLGKGSEFALRLPLRSAAE